MRNQLIIAVVLCVRPATGDPVANETRFDMRRHFSDLVEITHLLLVGKLEDARTRAFLLTKPPKDPDIARASKPVIDAAEELGEAQSIDAACRLTAKVAAACAGCHVQIPIVLRAPAKPEEPSAEPRIDVRMQRHQWAADRLWEGVVMGDAQRWRDGLQVLAMQPVPMVMGDGLAHRLQAQAQGALDRLGTDTYETRASAYGEMLVTCSECHRARQAAFRGTPAPGQRPAG
jgi:cytochrome c553